MIYQMIITPTTLYPSMNLSLSKVQLLTCINHTKLQYKYQEYMDLSTQGLQTNPPLL